MFSAFRGLCCVYAFVKILCDPQGYQFEEENPYLSHEDPLAEGVKRMEAGDIPGAVRLFESAVQREPDNQLVRVPCPTVYYRSVFEPVL